jgi:glyceraldehyde 3-phosphate dehydrogenase
MKHLVVTNGRQLGISLMHDNEVAYCCRVLDILGVLSAAYEAKNILKLVEPIALQA